MERSSTIGYILIFFLFLGFWFFNKDTVQQLENQEQISEVNEDSINLNQSNVSISSDNDSAHHLDKINEEIITLKNSVLKIDFTNIGGIPKVVNLLDYKKYDSTELLLIDSNQLHFEYSLPLSNGHVLNTSELEFELTQTTDNSVSYTYSNDGSEIVQTYTLEPNSYRLDYALSFTGFDRKISPNNRFAELNWKSKTKVIAKNCPLLGMVSKLLYS